MQILQKPGLYWRAALLEIRNIRSLAGSGILAALGSVLKMWTIPLGQVLRFGFSFLPTALSGYLYGPFVAGFAGVVVDIIGFMLNPTGPYFFGFTLNAFLGGFLYGCWLWKQPVKLWRTAAACLTFTVVVSFILSPLWLNILYGDAFLALVWMRVPKNAIELPLNILILYPMLKLAERQKKYLVKE